MTEKVEKTIEMLAASADKWLNGLRSDKFKQGTGTLCQENMDGELEYCCLGVQQAVLSKGKVQQGDLPTLRWLRDHKIKVNYYTDNFDGLDEGRNTQVDIVLNPPVKAKGRVCHSVADLNDSGRFSFKEIADILDKRIKRV